MGIEGTYLNILKATYDKPTASIILNGKKTASIASEIRKKTRMFTFTSLIQHSTGSPSQNNQTRRRNKTHLNWKGRSKNLFICKWHNVVYRKPKDYTRKLWDLKNEFGKVAGHKINIQKSVTFLYTNNGLEKEKLKKHSHLLLQQKLINKVPRNKFNQGGKDLYSKNYRTLKKQIKEDTNNWKHIPCSWIGRINIIKISTLPKAIYRLNQFLLKYQWHISQI